MLSSLFAHAGRELRAVAMGATATHRRLRGHLLLIGLATLGVDLVCALLAWLLERHARGTAFTTLPGALFWTTTQLLTVSSQLPNPITAGAKGLDVFMEVWAISVVTALGGSLASFFHRRGHERLGPPQPEHWASS